MAHKKLLAKIHIALKQLGIEDEHYRRMLYDKFRVRSSKSLSDSQAVVLIHHFKNLGWVPKASKQEAVSSFQPRFQPVGLTGRRVGASLRGGSPYGAEPSPEGKQEAPASGSNKQKKYEDSPRDLYDASGAIKRKVEAMWHDYYRGNEETKHLRQWLFRHFQISDVNLLDKRAAYDAVEALKSMTRRRGE